MICEVPRASRDCVLSSDFFPTIGGAHTWLYEVYRRWPTPVEILTYEYSKSGIQARAERDFDSRQHGALQIYRVVPRFGAISILNPRFLRSMGSCIKATRQRGQKWPQRRIHVLRAFPDGFAGYLVWRLNPYGTQLITYAHGEEILVAKSSMELSYMTRLVYGNSSVVIANSEHTRRAVLEIAPRANVVVVHPGVDCGSFRVNREAVELYRRGLGWEPGTTVVLTLGRMEARKNHAGVMRAVSLLRREGLSVAYVCAGDGVERGGLIELAKSLNMKSWVRFPQMVSEGEKRILFGASDLFAMPSIQSGAMIEGFGIVFLEAAASGLPSISGNNGGQMEAVQHGVTGLAVDGRRDEEIAAAIRDLVINVEQRKRMACAARQWAGQHDWQHVVCKTLAVVDREN